ncbi:MAG TPA: type II toxin-antitoxin system prevent-host-death family antitoxin [Anaerolineae bacterium]|nr:type II toxin-antitoxin system prevent-host-death family antitoxin [Anaerolineae bacterium]
MPTKTIEVKQTQTYLTDLLSQVVKGSEIILTQGNTPIARLIPITDTPATPRVAGLHLNAIRTSDDFDESLPDEFWLGKE